MKADMSRTISWDEVLRRGAEAWSAFLQGGADRTVAEEAIGWLQAALEEGDATDDAPLRRVTRSLLALFHWGLAKYVEHEAGPRAEQFRKAHDYAVEGYDMALRGDSRCRFGMDAQGTAAYLADLLDGPVEKRQWADVSLRFRERYLNDLQQALADLWAPEAPWGTRNPGEQWTTGQSEFFEGHARCVLAGLEEEAGTSLDTYGAGVRTLIKGLRESYDSLRLGDADKAMRHILDYEHGVARELVRRYLVTKARVAAEAEGSMDSDTAKVLDFLPQLFVETEPPTPLDEAGWVTLSQISRLAGVSRRSLYGENHSAGRVVRRLREMRLIEEQDVDGMPGRGGRVHMVRMRL